MIIDFSALVSRWDSDEFNVRFKEAVEQLSNHQLPLQEGLAHSSYVSTEPFNVVILETDADTETLHVRIGVFYSGIIAGCSCADDPTPVESQTEYCVLQFDINKQNGLANVTLLP